MWSDAVLRDEVAEAAGVELSKARSARVDLTCWFGNRSVTGAVCLDASNRGASCAQRMEWSGAVVSLLVSGVIWGMVTLVFVLSFGSFFRRREVKWRHERLRILKSSVHLDLWRFLVQRDLREEQARPPLPANACIRADGPANATQCRSARSGAPPVPRAGALPSAPTATEASHSSDRKRFAAGGHRRPLSVIRRQGSLGGRLVRSKGVAGASGGHDGSNSAPKLSAHALMYLPPLTVYLLHANPRDRPNNCSSKMLESHTQQSEEMAPSPQSQRTRLLSSAPPATPGADTGTGTGTGIAISTGTRTSPGPSVTSMGAPPRTSGHGTGIWTGTGAAASGRLRSTSPTSCTRAGPHAYNAAQASPSCSPAVEHMCELAPLASANGAHTHGFADAGSASEQPVPGNTRVRAEEDGGGSSSAFSMSSVEDDAARRV